MKSLRSIPARRHAQYVRLFVTTALAFGCGPSLLAQSLCIPSATGLPWVNGWSVSPTIDGYVERIEGVSDLNTDPVAEPGWVGSELVSYGMGSSSFNSEFRADTDGTSLYLSFVVQFDPDFDDDDSVVVVLDPQWSQSATNFSTSARRLIISPVASGAGAPGAVGSGNFCIRANRLPRNVYWSGFSGSSWTDIAAPSGSAVMVRSWEGGACGSLNTDKNWSIEVKVPRTAGTDWVNLGSTLGLYTNIINLCSTSSCNGAPPAQDYFTNQFTWPRSTTTAPGPGFYYLTGTAATLKDLVNQSVQAQWLRQASFVFSATSACSGVRFAQGATSIGVRDPMNPNAPLGSTINGVNQATNTLVAQVENDGATADGQGVRVEFRIANWGIGPGTGTNPTFPGTWDTIGAPASGGKTFGTVPSVNLPSSGELNANLLNSNPSARVDIPSGGATGEIWEQMQVLPTDGYCDPSLMSCPAGSRDAHSCIWAQLDSNQNATISQSSMYRNFHVNTMSAQKYSAEISGRGWERGPILGGPQQFLILTSRRYYYFPGTGDLPSANTMAGAVVGKVNIPAPEGISAKLLQRPNEVERGLLAPPLESELLKAVQPGKGPQWSYVWMEHANRATPLTMTIGQKTYRIYEPAGSFGLVGEHAGQPDRFRDLLTGGPDLRAIDQKGTYALTVPDGKAARLDTVTAVLQPGEPDPTQPCPQPGACHGFSRPGTCMASLMLLGIGFSFRRRGRDSKRDGEAASGPAWTEARSRE